MKKDLEQPFYLISIVSVFLGGIFWLTEINFQAQANTDDIRQIKVKADETARAFEEIRTRLTHIEDAVGARKKGE